MIDKVAVIVPAANEQDHICACLVAIGRARRELLRNSSNVVQVEVVVVLDDCQDATPALVARFAVEPHVHAITSTAHRVGAARRLGARQAVAMLAPAQRLWLANTDADSLVPRDWLTRMVNAADCGAQLILGTVLPGAELPSALRTAWLAQHQLSEGHPHIHGANLGIRADTYLGLGGWRDDLASDEDVDLAARASIAGDINILRTATIPVVTSARTLGRAPLGFSGFLRDLTAS